MHSSAAIRVVDPDSGQVQQIQHGVDGLPQRSVGRDADGRWLIPFLSKGSLKLWNAAKGRNAIVVDKVGGE